MVGVVILGFSEVEEEHGEERADGEDADREAYAEVDPVHARLFLMSSQAEITTT